LFSSVQFSSLFNKQFSEVVSVLVVSVSLKPGSKLLATYGWRAEMWWKWVPGDWSSDREAPSTKLSCSDSWNEQITSIKYFAKLLSKIVIFKDQH